MLCLRCSGRSKKKLPEDAEVDGVRRTGSSRSSLPQGEAVTSSLQLGYSGFWGDERVKFRGLGGGVNKDIGLEKEKPPTRPRVPQQDHASSKLKVSNGDVIPPQPKAVKGERVPLSQKFHKGDKSPLQSVRASKGDKTLPQAKANKGERTPLQSVRVATVDRTSLQQRAVKEDKTSLQPSVLKGDRTTLSRKAFKEDKVLPQARVSRGEKVPPPSIISKEEKTSVKSKIPKEDKASTSALSSSGPKEDKPLQNPNVPKEDRSTAALTRQFRSLGFPNPAQFCYMNSSLQSLLTLQEFIRDISCQRDIWSLSPEAMPIRTLMDIKQSHGSSDLRLKTSLLIQFKREVARWAPEFGDLGQKDSHEFLTSVLEQMRSLSPRLQRTAARMGKTYSCPVEDHLVFKMMIIRTCVSCGEGSIRVEEFTNLSLHMVHGGASLEQMLENYLTEKRLEYRCECGANTSGLCSSFVTLPKVLVLHLKRFRFTRSNKLKKLNDKVDIVRDLVVSSCQGGACYSLISTISHIGHGALSGHYVCDGADPDSGPGDPTDRWFTYDDVWVTETSGSSVAEERQETAYILFYRRHDFEDGRRVRPLTWRFRGPS